MEINGGDNVCILGGPRIYVAQLKEGSTTGFPWGNWDPVLFLFLLYRYPVHWYYIFLLYRYPDYTVDIVTVPTTELSQWFK